MTMLPTLLEASSGGSGPDNFARFYPQDLPLVSEIRQVARFPYGELARICSGRPSLCISDTTDALLDFSHISETQYRGGVAEYLALNQQRSEALSREYNTFVPMSSKAPLACIVVGVVLALTGKGRVPLMLGGMVLLCAGIGLGVRNFHKSADRNEEVRSRMSQINAEFDSRANQSSYARLPRIPISRSDPLTELQIETRPPRPPTKGGGGDWGEF